MLSDYTIAIEYQLFVVVGRLEVATFLMHLPQVPGYVLTLGWTVPR